MYTWGKGRAAGRVESGQTFCRQSRVGSSRVNVSPGRVGSKKSDPWTTLRWIGMRRSNIRHVLETSVYPTAIARGGTEFRSQVFLGTSVQ